MTSEDERLARRAVAAGWLWLPGAADTRGGRVVERLMFAGGVKLDNPSIRYAGPNGGASWHGERFFATHGPSGFMAITPDFADRATLGCLEEVVAKAWNAEIVVLKEVIRSGPHAGKISHRVAVFRPEMSVDWGWTERYLFESAPERAFRPISQAEALIIALEAAPALEATP